MSEISIVIPILNEAKNILLLVPEINKVKKKLKINKFEILLIDDNSDDNIKEVVKKLRKKYKYLKLFIRKNKNKDLSQSCILGFEKASFKNILVMDGDYQHSPKYIIKMFKVYLKENCDIVVGSRDLIKKQSRGLSQVRRLFSIILILLINFLLGNKTKDPMSGYFIFNKKIFVKNKKNMFGYGYKILSDLIYSSNKNIKIKDVTILFDRRVSGKSKMNISILLILLSFIFVNYLKKILKIS
tara:strand:- start:2 stop:727 length:726 start_codon:yes stop_codon:yes gene_type:complete